MFRKPHIPLFDFVWSLSRVMDLMDTNVVDHHLRVAYITLSVATQAGIPADSRRHAVLAAALHDVGAFHFSKRLHLLQFDAEDLNQHAEAGYLLLRMFEPFAEMAEMVRYHHVPWNDGEGKLWRGNSVPLESHLIHLADRIAVAIPTDQPVLRQVNAIRDKIVERSGKAFVPGFVEAFCALAPREYFWLEATSTSLEPILRRRLPPQWIEIEPTRLTHFAHLLCRIIDFKSEFTAAHSSGVASSAVALARYAGFSEYEQELMKIAAYLHDLGKLAIPAEILEKPGEFTSEEREVMRSHVYYTYEVLSRIEGLETITEWSSLHQERINGKGYPFHYNGEELGLGARILAVADVFTALTEERPYRPAIPREKAISLLRDMAEKGELDGHVMEILFRHWEEIDGLRAAGQQAALKEYREFVEALQFA